MFGLAAANSVGQLAVGEQTLSHDWPIANEPRDGHWTDMETAIES